MDQPRDRGILLHQICANKEIDIYRIGTLLGDDLHGALQIFSHLPKFFGTLPSSLRRSAYAR
jgi:hypothetical protein